MATSIPTWQNVQANFSGSNQSLANAQQGFARAGAGADAADAVSGLSATGALAGFFTGAAGFAG